MKLASPSSIQTPEDSDSIWQKLSLIPDYVISTENSEPVLSPAKSMSSPAWQQAAVTQEFSALILGRDVAKLLKHIGTYGVEVAGYVFGIIEDGKFSVIGAECIAMGDEESVYLRDPYGSPPLNRWLRDCAFNQLKNDIPEIVTMTFHNHPGRIPKSVLESQDGRRLIESYEIAIDRGDYDFLKRYFPVVRPENCYWWEMHGNLSAADLNIPGRAKLLIRDSWFSGTPEERLVCYDTGEGANETDIELLPEIPVVCEHGQLTDRFRDALQSARKASNSIMQINKQLIGSYDGRVFYDLADGSTNEATLRDELSESQFNNVQLSYAIWLEELKAFGISDRHAPPIPFGDFELNSERQSVFLEERGLYVPSTDTKPESPFKPFNGLDFPKGEAVLLSNGAFLKQAWLRNHEILLNEICTRALPLLVFRGLAEEQFGAALENIPKGFFDLDDRYRSYTFKKSSDPEAYLFQLYKCAQAAFLRTGLIPGNAEDQPGGGILLFKPDGIKIKGPHFSEQVKAQQIVLATDTEKQIHYFNNPEVFPYRTSISSLHPLREAYLGAIPVEWLLPITTERTRESAGLDQQQLSQHEFRIIQQKIAAIALGMAFEESDIK